MAARIAAAAARSGIRLTLLPVFYAHGNFGGAAPDPRQRRFVSTLDQYARLVERCGDTVVCLDGAVTGVAPHSLRAVTAEELRMVIALCPDGPIHIHAAEQAREVAACLAWSGQRPVQWLLDHAPVDGRWCVVHATHMDDGEVARLAASGAVAGLCPLTEANLGDGTFRGRDWIAHNGLWGIGSDSNVQVDAAAELRQLEYSQRLAHQARNVLSAEGVPTARSLVQGALAGGSAALGAGDASIRAGAPADLVALAADDVDPADGDAVLSGWVFTGRTRVDAVWVGGQQLVAGGRHVRRDEVHARFRRAIGALIAGR
jgi:formiminoglutamate deiminase